MRLDREAEVELIGEPVIDGTIDPSGFARSALAARDKALGLAAAEPKPGRSYSAEELNRMAVSSPKAFGRLVVDLPSAREVANERRRQTRCVDAARREGQRGRGAARSPDRRRGGPPADFPAIPTSID